MQEFWKHGIRLFGIADPVQFLVQDAEGKWNGAEEFNHALKSVVALCSALKHGPDGLKQFGVPKRDVLTFGEVQDWYNTELEKLKLRNPPNPMSPGNPRILDLESMKGHWVETSEKFGERLELFGETDLDHCSIPHPLLGAMYLREMLFFTILHTRHHLESVERKITRGQAL